jgi:Lar family restriction alleviation protein
MKTPKLKPCPFCGGEPCQHSGSTSYGHYCSWIECRKCHSMGPVRKTEAGSAKAWNRRHKQRKKAPRVSYSSYGPEWY